MENKKRKYISLSQIAKKAGGFSGKPGMVHDGSGYFPNRNAEESMEVEAKLKIKSKKIFSKIKELKGTYEEDKDDKGEMRYVPEKMVKHKWDKDSGRIKSNPKFINPNDNMKFIEESSMKISKKQIKQMIRSEIRTAVNEMRQGRISEKTRGVSAGKGAVAASSVSKGGFTIKDRSKVAGDRYGGSRTTRDSGTEKTGGRGIKASKGRADVSTAMKTQGAARLADYTAARATGGRNAISGKISSGYIAQKSSAISTYNTIINRQISTLTSLRNNYSSGTVLYVALQNLMNQLAYRKTEYSAKWDYAQAIYDNNSANKGKAKSAISSARVGRRGAKPVGVDPPPPPPPPAGPKAWVAGTEYKFGDTVLGSNKTTYLATAGKGWSEKDLGAVDPAAKKGHPMWAAQ